MSSGKPAGKVQKREVECPVHGIHYDPEVTPECVLCLKYSQPERTGGRRKGGVWLLVLLAAVVGFLFYRSVGPYLSGRTTPTSSGAVDKPQEPFSWFMSPAVMDPSPYKAQITTIESILYKKSPVSSGDIGVLERTGQELSEQIGKDAGAIAPQVSSDLMFWVAALGSEEESGYALPDLSRARAEWEKLREHHFERKPWFQAVGGKETSLAQRPRPPEADPEVVRGLRESARAIVRLIDEGRRECERLGEIVGEADREAPKKIAEWRQWSQQWEGRVRQAAATLSPGARRSAHPDVSMANQSLEFAVHSLRLVPNAANDFGVPFYSERERRFNEALAHVQTAEDYLARVK
ncbi:MAG: hypothetical protein EHM61_04990 [Acidobacteria bacterium]|nr:MAG: hypothetical protein EHM61_04990 [Acidobacteriota bacterium]